MIKLKSFLHPLRSYRNRKRYIFSQSDKFKELMWTNPKDALDIFWMVQMQYPLDWDNPITLNEKNFWLEGMTDTTIWTKLSDKYLVRDYIKEKGLEYILNNCYGAWDNFDDIPFDKLPSSFVIKCNHDCGSTKIIKNKEDVFQYRDFYNLRVSIPYGYDTCEPHYLRIERKILIEELLVPGEVTSSSLIDYKFFCCNGKAQCCMVCYNRGAENEIHDIYDVRDWTRFRNISDTYKNQPFRHLVPKPDNLDEMIRVAEILAKQFPFVRVDLYNLNGKRIVFGEMTFTPRGGLQACFNNQAQIELGELISLPNRNLWIMHQ